MIFTGDRSGDFLVRGAAPDGFRQPAGLAEQGRRAAALGALDLGRRPVRPAAEQTDPGRARRLPTLRRPRTGGARREGRRLPRRLRLGRRPATARERGRSRSSPTARSVKPARSYLSVATIHRSRIPLPGCSPPRCSTPSCRGRDPAPCSYPEREKTKISSDRMDAHGFR